MKCACLIVLAVTVYRTSCEKPRPTKPERAGQPLYLTPFLVRGNIKAAREQSRVGPIGGSPDLESYAGFLTVREQLKNHLFFWFFPALKKAKWRAPVMLWLQGGPGSPSMFGLLLEHGPLHFSIGDNTASFREHTWAHNISMVYVDQPVGTGYSHSFHETNGYAKTVSDAAADLYEFLGQFYVLFPELRANDFYIAGESYAGKFVMAVAMMMNMLKDDDSLPKLRGLVLGNAYIDPEMQSDLSEYFYQLGFLNRWQANNMRSKVERAVRLIRKQKFADAKRIMDDLTDRSPSGHATFFWNATGLKQMYNFDLTSEPPEFSAYTTFMERQDVRKALHVGALPFRDDDRVLEHMYADLMSSQKHNFAALLDAGYKVLMYSGQKDMIVPFCTTQRLMESVRWKGEQQYRITSRTPWRLGLTNIAGYYITIRNYTEVLIRGAGHVVPFDQPYEAYVLMNRFVYGQSLQDLD